MCSTTPTTHSSSGQPSRLTGGAGVAAVYDGVGESTFDASLASLAVRGTLVLFGATSGAVPPVNPKRLNAAGLVYLTRPSRLHFIRTRDAFTWRTNQLFDAIATGTVNANVTPTIRSRMRLKPTAILRAAKRSGRSY